MPAAFTVQTDAGTVADANAYIDVAFFRQYHLDRGTDTTAILDGAAQTGIVLATDYIDNRWRLRFPGQPLVVGQSTEWPRANVVDSYGNDVLGLPRELKRACAEYALRAARNGQLVADAPPPVANGEMNLGAPIEVEVEVPGAIRELKRWAEGSLPPAAYAGGTDTTGGQLLPAIPAADMLIERLLDGGGRQRRAVRA